MAAGSRRLPRAASIPIAPARSTPASPPRFNRVMLRWPAAFAGTDLDPDANRKRMEALVKRVEDLAASLAGGPAAADASLSPTTGWRRC